jgi:DNA polymerase
MASEDEAASGQQGESVVSPVHVVADGPAHASLVFVGAMPGRGEPNDGRPFGGAAGELLDKMIAAMGLRRQNVVLLTVSVESSDGAAPPPTSALVAAITAELERLSPAVVVSLGEVLSRTLTGANASLQAMRGHFHLVALPNGRTVEVMPTLPPAHLLENPGDKRGVWEDLRRVMGALGLPGGVPREPTS